METCLVTKLKGVVNDDALKKFDRFRIEQFTPDPEDYSIIKIQAGKTVVEHYIDKETGEEMGSKVRVGTGVSVPIVCRDCFVEYENYWYIDRLEPRYFCKYDIALYKYNRSITSLELSVLSADAHSVTGDIASLGECIQLTTVNIGSSAVVGSINELAEKMIAEGRTSDNLNIWVSGVTGLKYNGTAIRNKNRVKITFDSSLEKGYSVEIS